MTLYYFFDDLVGPIATVIAAGVALYATMHVVRRQKKGAESQSAKLRNNLRAVTFRSKLDVYAAISNVAQIALDNGGNNQFVIEDLQTSTAKILEGKFLFAPDIYTISEEFLDKSHALIAMKTDRALLDKNSPISIAKAAKIAASQADLSVLFRRLSRKFEA